MRIRPVIDASDFSRVNPDRKDPLWWGIWGLIAIELTVVSGFIVSYLYLRMGPPDWPPYGLEPPPLLYETINAGLLIGSAVAMTWAGKRITKGDNRGLVVGLAVALLLNLAVLPLRWLQMEAFDFTWYDHAYGSIVWTMTGFHFVHVVSAIVGTAVIEILAIRGFWTPKRQLAVVVDTMYWNFVSLVWIPIYLTLYWIPRLL